MNFERELDELYALPFDEFTRARDALARRARDAGDREASAAIKALAKPTVTAWAVNQLSRRDEVGMRALLRAAERLRSAGEGVLGGDASAAHDLQEATRDEREAVSRLTATARAILAERDDAPSQQLIDRIAGTLHAVATDDAGRELVRTGRLTRDLDPSGFALPLGGAPVRRTKASRPRPAAPDKQARERVRVLREQATALERAAEEARDRATAAGKELRGAERDAERAAARAQRAREQLEAAEAKLRAQGPRTRGRS